LGWFKIDPRHADECNVENDHHVAEPHPAERAGAPSLPPRLASPTYSDDVWNGVESEPDFVHRHAEHSHHEPIFLAPTSIARVLAATGWFGGVLATALLMVALVPAFREGETRNFMVSLDDNPWFGAILIVSCCVTYLGWLWWSVSAAFNARRLAPLSTSPWLPVGVYLIGPLIVLAGLDVDEDYVGLIVFCGCAWIGIGHLIVVASLRSTARRIGASVAEFSRLLWLPLAWTSYRLFVNTMLTFVDDSYKGPALLVTLGGFGALYLVATAVTTWRAIGSFDHACWRLNTRSLGLELPTADMVSAAIHQRALEGR
jgi:hypothetical protein